MTDFTATTALSKEDRNARLEKVRQYALLHPDEFDMSFWIRTTPCGTTRCIAGTAVFLFAPEAKVSSMFDGEGNLSEAAMDLVTMHPGDEPVLIEHAAQDLLGLTYEQANVLFYSEQHWEGVLDDIVADLMEDD